LVHERVWGRYRKSKRGSSGTRRFDIEDVVVEELAGVARCQLVGAGAGGVRREDEAELLTAPARLVGWLEENRHWST